MNKLTATVCLLVLAGVMSTATSAAPVPCEQMLDQVRSALKTATLSDAERAKVVDLENKGIERCKADDDTHADEFFQQALILMGK